MAAALVVALGALASSWRQPETLGAAEVVRRARLTSEQPPSGGIDRLVATVHTTWQFDGETAAIGVVGSAALVTMPPDAIAIRGAPADASGSSFSEHVPAIAALPSGAIVTATGITGAEARLGGRFEQTTRVWYDATGRYRREITLAGATGYMTTIVADGVSLWTLDHTHNWVMQAPYAPPQGLLGVIDPFAGGLADISALLRESDCRSPRLVERRARVAARPAYLVETDADCARVSAPLLGRARLWIDRETFLVLRVERLAPNGDRVAVTSELSAVTINGSIEAERLTFTPPPGASTPPLLPVDPADLRATPGIPALPPTPRATTGDGPSDH